MRNLLRRVHNTFVIPSSYCIYQWFLFIAEDYFIVWMRYGLFNYSPVEEMWIVFRFWKL